MNPPINNNPNQNDDNDEIENNHHHLSHRELLMRRLQNTRGLFRHYQDIYWDLIVNQLRFLLTLYMLENPGISPFQEEPQRRKCAFDGGCEKKAMPCTTFCFAHILSDPRQVLYKPCQFLISSAAESGGGGAIICRKPVDRWAVPCYCVEHMRMSNEKEDDEEEEEGSYESTTGDQKEDPPKE